MIIGTHLQFRKEGFPAELLEEMTFANPEYFKKLGLGLSVKNVPETVQLYTEDEEYYYVPRNYPMPKDLMKIERDDRVDGHHVTFKSILIPRDEEQAEAIKVLASAESGILEAACGRGKTCMAIDALSKVGVTTLILVHTEFLVHQWEDRIHEFLGEEAGIIQGKKCDFKNHKICIGLIQSFIHPEKYPKELFEYFGLVITDEVHRVGSKEWSSVIQLFPARRRWGLTATPNRSDGMERVFKAHLGDIVYTINGENLVPRVAFIPTPTTCNLKDIVNRYTRQISIPNLLSILSRDRVRNNQIMAILENALSKGRKVIVLGERVAQLEELCARVPSKYKAMLYVGKTPQSERDTAHEKDVIFGTLSLAKEGLDIPELDTLMLISPTSSDITLQQATGRILRQHEGKKEPIVIDLVDENIGVCNGMKNKRTRLYQKLGYTIS